MIDQERAARIRDASYKAIVRTALAATEARLSEAAPVNGHSPPSVQLKGHRATSLPALIRKRSTEPWVSLSLAGEEVARLRLGSVATVTGGPGAGKSTLALAFMIEHVRNHGPGVYCSIELDADELGARGIGMQCDASWEDVLRGRVADEDMARALDMPRLSILDGENAALASLTNEVAALRAEYPHQPILVIVDYIQIVEGTENQVRERVAAVAQKLRRIAKKLQVVVLGISQPSRAAGKQLGAGELLGLDTMTAMAESAEIERAAYVTLAIGSQGALRDDGTCIADLSTGKGRMGGGDRVFRLEVCPRTGRMRVDGESRLASEVRAERTAKRDTEKVERAAHAIAGLLAQAKEPMSRKRIKESLGGDGNVITAAVRLLREDGRAVRVRGKKAGGSWPVWTRERATEHGIDLVPDGIDE